MIVKVKAKTKRKKQHNRPGDPQLEAGAVAEAKAKARPRQGRPDAAVVASRPRVRRAHNAASSRVNRRAHRKVHRRVHSKLATSRAVKPRKRRKPEHPLKIQKISQLKTSREVVVAGVGVVVGVPANHARQKRSRLMSHRISR